MAKASKAEGEEVTRTPRCPQHSGKVVTDLSSDIVVVVRGWRKREGAMGEEMWWELKVGLGKAKES